MQDIEHWIGWTQSRLGEWIQGPLGYTSLPPPWNLSDIKPKLNLISYISRSDQVHSVSHSTPPDSFVQRFNAEFNTRGIVFIAHGFLNTGRTPWLTDMGKKLLERFKKDGESFTIAIIDWGDGANIAELQYANAAANAIEVGRWVGSYAKALREHHREMYIYGIGHSLGAHLIGSAGKASKISSTSAFNRITGLDPAGPLFEQYNTDIRLCKNDANVVDVIHTDGYYSKPYFGPNHYGTLIPLGTTDFYPNWGMEQPDCVNGSSSHSRAVELFMKSIDDPTKYKTRTELKSRPTFENIEKATKITPIEAQMGLHFRHDMERDGKCYYLRTEDRMELGRTVRRYDPMQDEL